jgi:hypothetical protein
MKPKKPVVRTETKIRSEFLNMKPERRAEMADSLMESSESKKNFASKQRAFGKMQAKGEPEMERKLGRKVQSGDYGNAYDSRFNGSRILTASERMDIAKKADMVAKKDSFQAEVLKKLNKLKK